jgi:hypothetical protein
MQADPVVKKIRLEINDFNRQIKEKSKAIGGASLPDSDPLVVGRNECFRRLKEARNH